MTAEENGNTFMYCHLLFSSFKLPLPCCIHSRFCGYSDFRICSPALALALSAQANRAVCTLPRLCLFYHEQCLLAEPLASWPSSNILNPEKALVSLFAWIVNGTVEVLPIFPLSGKRKLSPTHPLLYLGVTTVQFSYVARTFG